jgi:lycopene beta-cyclase
MTDMQVVNGDYCFTYLLPFSKNRILIEHTIFSSQPVTAENLYQPLNLLLESRGLNTASIIRTEHAMLPMGLPVDKTAPPRAGIGGGALRPSSGYGFMRIQRWARECATHFSEQSILTPHADSGFFLPRMDQLFLKVLRLQPQLTPTLFQQLLGQTNTERFIRFMNDEAHFLDYLNIVYSLPKAPFIKALISRPFKST